MFRAYCFVIMDVNHTEGDRIIELNAPEDLDAVGDILGHRDRKTTMR